VAAGDREETRQREGGKKTSRIGSGQLAPGTKVGTYWRCTKKFDRGREGESLISKSGTRSITSPKNSLRGGAKRKNFIEGGER